MTDTTCPCCHGYGAVRRTEPWDAESTKRGCGGCGCEWLESCRAPHPDTALIDALEKLEPHTRILIEKHRTECEAILGQFDCIGPTHRASTLRAALESLVSKMEKGK